MEGHDLLDTIRSATVWNAIKDTAQKKGIELSFEAIKALGAFALKQVLGAQYLHRRARAYEGTPLRWRNFSFPVNFQNYTFRRKGEPRWNGAFPLCSEPSASIVIHHHRQIFAFSYPSTYCDARYSANCHIGHM
ncbi:DUF2513 domain-containing protein [Herbaspirillum camelliae]|uniref:DUF2513 domain-containing protein n=1 Tax=Herbaspirillum camelliae TaxID=1892903 RepID=UPI000949CEE1|nr:DUF2513 domain-containing protein [Herbaspirillum camelliae]